MNKRDPKFLCRNCRPPARGGRWKREAELRIPPCLSRVFFWSVHGTVGLIFEQKAEIACEYGRFQSFDFFVFRADSYDLAASETKVKKGLLCMLLYAIIGKNKFF